MRSFSIEVRNIITPVKFDCVYNLEHIKLYLLEERTSLDTSMLSIFRCRSLFVSCLLMVGLSSTEAVPREASAYVSLYQKALAELG